MKLLIYSPTSVGGIAEHTNYQARAIARRFGRVDSGKDEMLFLCGSDFLAGRAVEYEKKEVFRRQISLGSARRGVLARGARLFSQSFKVIGDQWRLAWEIFRRKPDGVLIASYLGIEQENMQDVLF